MKINVIAVKSGWILTKIAERIVANAPDGVEMVIGPARPGENNFYVDVTNCYQGKVGKKDIGLFTHLHANSTDEIRPHWWSLDHIIHMSRRSKSMFQNAATVKSLNSFGADEPKTTHSNKMPGEAPEGFDYKKPTIGIFQRGQYEGKGFYFMEMLAENPIVKDFNWTFVGSGWNHIAELLHKKTKVICYDDDDVLWPGEYLDIYDEVDYVLIPSKWEGGPMGLLEAAARGKQIIAARVGWIGDEVAVDYDFKGGSYQELGSILKCLVKKRKKARKMVENLSYGNYARHVVRCFERIK